MAISLHTRIMDISSKLEKLMARYESVLEERNSLEHENAELHSEILRLRNILKERETDVEYLTMSHRLASDPNTLVTARRQVEGLIRDIDKCISQLKE